MKIIFDSQFQTDFKQVVRRYPHIKDEMRELIYAIEELGEVPPTCLLYTSDAADE